MSHTIQVIGLLLIRAFPGSSNFLTNTPSKSQNAKKILYWEPCSITRANSPRAKDDGETGRAEKFRENTQSATKKTTDSAKRRVSKEWEREGQKETIWVNLNCVTIYVVCGVLGRGVSLWARHICVKRLLPPADEGVRVYSPISKRRNLAANFLCHRFLLPPRPSSGLKIPRISRPQSCPFFPQKVIKKTCRTSAAMYRVTK